MNFEYVFLKFIINFTRAFFFFFFPLGLLKKPSIKFFYTLAGFRWQRYFERASLYLKRMSHETKNRGTYTRVTSMVPWLGFNLAETTSAWKRPSTAGAQLSEAPALEAESEETQRRGRPIVLETGTTKNELSRKFTRPSLRFQKTSG